MLPRFYLPFITVQNDTLAIQDKEIIYQLTKILRLKKNDIFIVFSPQIEYELIIKEITNEQITATAIEKRQAEREPTKKLVLYQSLLKKDKFEWILQKGVELGVHTFVPIISNNSITREISDNKLKRYHKIIIEATEQCGGQYLAKLENTLSFVDAIKKVQTASGQKIIAWEGQLGNKLSDSIDKKVKEYHLFIGSEGGFSPQEIEIAKTNNFTVVSLGNRILRAETAATAAISLILLS